MQYMIDGFFVDQAASSMKVSCLCYNGEAQVFTMAVFTFDFLPSGPLTIDPFFSTFALPDYSGGAGRLRQACEIILVVMVFLNLWGEWYEMRHWGLHHYLTDFWNVFDLSNCTMILVLSFSW